MASFKIVVFIAAVLFSLITTTAKATKPDVTDNLTYIEKALSNQELDLLDDSNSGVILIKTGNSSYSVLKLTGRGQPNNFSVILSSNGFNQIVAVFIRRDLDNITSIFTCKYNKYMKIKRTEFME